MVYAAQAAFYMLPDYLAQALWNMWHGLCIPLGRSLRASVVPCSFLSVVSDRAFPHIYAQAYYARAMRKKGLDARQGFRIKCVSGEIYGV